MGKCALCDTPGVNKSTCPLYVKNPKPENIPKTNQYEFLFVVILFQK